MFYSCGHFPSHRFFVFSFDWGRGKRKSKRKLAHKHTCKHLKSLVNYAEPQSEKNQSEESGEKSGKAEKRGQNTHTDRVTVISARLINST